MAAEAAAAAAAAAEAVAVEAAAAPRVAYRCAKCRQHLFSELQLTTHEPNVGQRAFRHRKRDSGPEAAVGCSSFFLCEEAMLGPAFSQVDGKLACPKCTARLGSYTWSGMQCSCGAWVAPAFQVVKSKVDEVLIKTR